MTIPQKIQTWQMVKPTDPKTGEKGILERAEVDVPALGPGDALVEVAGWEDELKAYYAQVLAGSDLDMAVDAVSSVRMLS